MAAPEVVTHLHTWIEIGIATMGFGGVIVTGIVGFRVNTQKLDGVDTKLGTVAEEVRKVNGTVRLHGEHIAAIEAKCAAVQDLKGKKV